MASTALLVVGLLGLVPGAVRSLYAQEAAGVTNSSAGQVVSAYLDYREVSYSFSHLDLAGDHEVLSFHEGADLEPEQGNSGLAEVGRRWEQ